MTAVSVVVPVHSGEAYLDDLATRLAAVRDHWNTDHPDVYLAELLLVDDASKDNSSHVMQALANKHQWIHPIVLSKNFGQHPATVAGILHSSGDWIVTMDEDLQHRPEQIETILRRAVSEYADIVYGAPQKTVHGVWYRDLSSKTFKKLFSYLTGNPAIQNFSSFRLCRGSVARAGASVAGHETYLDVSLTWFTDRFTVETLPMEDTRFKTTGESNYNIKGLLKHARRLVISSHNRVIRIAGYLGMLAILLAMIFGTRAIIARLTGTLEVFVPGWASLFVSILFFGGIIVFLLVISLEYLINIALHTQGKPTFFVVDRSDDDTVASSLGIKNDGPST